MGTTLATFQAVGNRPVVMDLFIMLNKGRLKDMAHFDTKYGGIASGPAPL